MNCNTYQNLCGEIFWTVKNNRAIFWTQKERTVSDAFFVLSKQFQKLVAHAVHTRIADTVVHFLVAPRCSAKAVLVKCSCDIFVPLECILRVSKVDNAVLTAVNCNISFLGNALCLGETLLKVLLTYLFSGDVCKVTKLVETYLAVLFSVVCDLSRVSKPEIVRHLVYPVSALVGEDKRVITMEGVNDVFVSRRCKVLHRVKRVVPVAADDYLHVLAVFSDDLYSLVGNAVPRIEEVLVSNLVEQLENESVLVLYIALCELLPKVVERLLQVGVVEKVLFALALTALAVSLSIVSLSAWA